MNKRNDNFWKAREEELAELIKQKELVDEEKRKLGKKIEDVQRSLKQHYKRNLKETETEVYKMFGKESLNDLTDEERRAYYTARQRVCRAKQKAI